MATLLHFEEKVHRKKLQRANTIPLLFSRLLCHILEHMGYPTKPHLERLHHCRERFTLAKWTQLAGDSFPIALPKPTPPMPPQWRGTIGRAFHIVYTTYPAPPMPEATSTDPLTTPPVPLAAPSTSEASITISATEFCAMDQHTAILHQIQQHLGLLPPPQPDIPRPSEPIAPAEETTPVEETTSRCPDLAHSEGSMDPSSPHEATIEPSSSHDP
ncbi:hypothetical protein AAG906_041167 [Vitis piasezkii]